MCIGKECNDAAIIISLKNGVAEMKRRSRACVLPFHNKSKIKIREEYYVRVLHLFMPWRNDSKLKSGAQDLK